MSISGSDHALMVARLGVMRLGASRLNFFQPWLRFEIDGVAQTGNVRMVGCTVQENTDGTPWTCRARVSGFTPLPGNDIKIYTGDTDAAHRLFAGIVLTVTKTREPLSNIVVYDLDCVDYSWELNKQKVMARWTSESISSIVSSVISTWTRGFTVEVEEGLDTIGEFTATNEDVSDILDRLAVFAGARWWVDGARVIHFTTQAGEATTPVTDEMAGWGLSLTSPPQLSSTIAQRITRYLVRGGGAQALIQVPVGAASIPVADGTWYPETQDVQGGVGTTWTSRLESGTQRFDYASVRRADVSNRTTMATDALAGATTLDVTDQAVLPNTGWLSIDGIIVFYFKTSGTINVLPLNADGTYPPLPAYGSLSADVKAGATVILLSSLEGVTNVTQVIPAGQDISILYDVADVPAMTDFQDDLGAANVLDGRVDGFETDGRWGHEETKARALALLDLRKQNHDEVTFVTRDQTMKVGREVAFTLTTPPINGTFKIQSVTVTEIAIDGPRQILFPLRSVTASSERFTLERLLRRIRKVT